ncbi:MAG TPA: hypothetical protein VGC76_15475 [Pyrinomonadaceae bacterium]|jgi:hypothetical protein
MSNKNFQTEENEILSVEDEKVRLMLSDLKRVEAPKDFDFRLKARIARGAPERQKTGWFPLLRYVAPLCLAIIVLAVLVINGLYSVDQISAPPLAANRALPPIENINSASAAQPKEQFVADDANPPPPSFENTANASKKETRVFPKDSELAANIEKPKTEKPKMENNGGGSRDSAVANANPLLPNGFTPNKFNQVKDVLLIIGIDAAFSDNKWKVKSVAENSKAANAGVKTDDVIEAIDGSALASETIPAKKSYSGKLTIARGAEKLEIKLQNK